MFGRFLSSSIRRPGGTAGGQALRVKEDMSSAKGEQTKPTFKKRASRLTGRIREEVASKCLGEVSVGEQRPDLVANVSAHVVRGRGDIINNLRTAVDDGDDVLEVMARDDVIPAASVKAKPEMHLGLSSRLRTPRFRSAFSARIQPEEPFSGGAQTWNRSSRLQSDYGIDAGLTLSR